jgi:hypothetical protein
MERNRARAWTGKIPTTQGRRMYFASAQHSISADLGNIGRVTIDMLPDLALLEILDFFLHKNSEAWRTLIHVCRRWRIVVFRSPRRLNLQLVCTARTSMSQTLAVWPPLPIFIKDWSRSLANSDLDNVVAALEHNDRVRGIMLMGVPSLQVENVLAAMEEPFPELTILELRSEGGTTAVIPNSFLGGSAPRLHFLSLNRIPFQFPVLRKLHSSATHLVCLYLIKIPPSAYISPDAMVTCLSTLTRLETLRLEFESPPLRPVFPGQHIPPPTRTILPSLNRLGFQGVSEYLEDLVARIDAPLFVYLGITFFHQLIFDTPQLALFISRTPKLNASVKLPDGVHIVFSGAGVRVTLFSSPPRTVPIEGLMLRIPCRELDWQLSSLAQLFSSSFPLIPSLDRLYISKRKHSHWQNDVENVQWLEFLRPLTAVKELYLSQDFAPRVALALQELVGRRATEVLPALQSIFMEGPYPSGPVQKATGQFVAARQLFSHPIVVSHWVREEDEWWVYDDSER